MTPAGYVSGPSAAAGAGEAGAIAVASEGVEPMKVTAGGSGVAVGPEIVTAGGAEVVGLPEPQAASKRVKTMRGEVKREKFKWVIKISKSPSRSVINKSSGDSSIDDRPNSNGPKYPIRNTRYAISIAYRVLRLIH